MKGFTQNTDEFMIKLWKHLARDYRRDFGSDYKSTDESLIDISDMSRFRTRPQIGLMGLHNTDLFKSEVQLRDLFKRYKFKNDPFTQKDLETGQYHKFMATQLRVAQQPLVMTQLVRRVIQKARTIVKRMLGEYVHEEHMEHFTFGKRSSVGCPLSESYLDSRLARPISGSKEHQIWFQNQYLPTDPMLEVAIRRIQLKAKIGVPYKHCSTLHVVAVPKKWDSMRTILPQSTLGSSYFLALGNYMVDRMAKNGYRLSTLQDKHRALVCKFSMTLSHSTGDLSEASDSFYNDVINMLLPRAWYVATKKGRILNATLGLKNQENLLSSFMTMGVGYTFPLQTVLFYSLIEAIRTLAGAQGFCSVYGDDLIYPSVIHKQVGYVLSCLRFKLNADKTFCEAPFRESCGADYFRGIEVRAYQPEGVYCQMGKADYLATLYKTWNNLARHWDMRKKLPITAHFLHKEMLRCYGVVHQVPMGYPDFSGIQTKDILTDWYIPYSPVEVKVLPNGDGQTPNIKNFTIMFKCLDTKPAYREVLDQKVYLWDKLRSAQFSCAESSKFSPYSDTQDLLVWRPAYKKVKGVKVKVGLMACVTEKQNSRFSIGEHRSISDWSEVAC